MRIEKKKKKKQNQEHYHQIKTKTKTNLSNFITGATGPKISSRHTLIPHSPSERIVGEKKFPPRGCFSPPTTTFAPKAIAFLTLKEKRKGKGIQVIRIMPINNHPDTTSSTPHPQHITKTNQTLCFSTALSLIKGPWDTPPSIPGPTFIFCTAEEIFQRIRHKFCCGQKIWRGGSFEKGEN